MNELKWCEFFIGIGSGLSWLAWALGKKVVMISGFSNPICEFQTGNINVHNYNVCNGCFNKYQFDKGDWNWCPEHKRTDRQFECSRNITPKMVIDRIISSKLIQNVQPFDFDNYNINLKLIKDDFVITYEKENNKFIIAYKGEIVTPEICVEFKNFYDNKTYHILSDATFNKDYTIWCAPPDIIHEQTNKIIASFYEKEKLLDIEIDI